MPHTLHDNCEDQGFLLPKCSKTKAACRDKNAARVTDRHISSAPSNNQPLGEFRKDWGLQQLIILELQDPYRSWAQISWDKSPTLLGPHWRWSCPVDICHRWHLVLLLFIWGRKGKEEVSWPRKGPWGCGLGIQQPHSAACLLSSCSSVGQWLQLLTLLDFPSALTQRSVCFCCSHGSHKISAFLSRGKLES